MIPCPRAGCGKTARPVRCGGDWKRDHGRGIYAHGESHVDLLPSPTVGAPVLDPTVIRFSIPPATQTPPVRPTRRGTPPGSHPLMPSARTEHNGGHPSPAVGAPDLGPTGLPMECDLSKNTLLLSSIRQKHQELSSCNSDSNLRSAKFCCVARPLT